MYMTFNDVGRQYKVPMNLGAVRKLQTSLHSSLCDGSRTFGRKNSAPGEPISRSQSGIRPKFYPLRCYGAPEDKQWPGDGEIFPVQRPRRDHADLGPSLQLSREEAVEMQLNVRCKVNDLLQLP